MENIMNTTKATESLALALNANLPIFLQGSPGVGKSSIVKAIADKNNFALIDIRLSQCDITDLNGLPKFENGKATFTPFDIFPLENTPLPEGKKGWVLFLDELNSAMPAVQCAAYKLILDRMVGTHKLHKNVRIVAAGNKITDNAVVNELSTALKSRLINLTVECDADSWLAWAGAHDIDSRVMGFILNEKNKALFNFNPEKEDSTFACPRTWAMLSALIKPLTSLDGYDELIAGTIGNEMAQKFKTFTRCADKLPSWESLVEGTFQPKQDTEDLGIRWHIMGTIVSRYKEIKNDTEINNILSIFDIYGKDFKKALLAQFQRSGANTYLAKFPSFFKHVSDCAFHTGKFVNEL